MISTRSAIGGSGARAGGGGSGASGGGALTVAATARGDGRWRGTAPTSGGGRLIGNEAIIGDTVGVNEPDDEVVEELMSAMNTGGGNDATSARLCCDDDGVRSWLPGVQGVSPPPSFLRFLAASLASLACCFLSFSSWRFFSFSCFFLSFSSFFWSFVLMAVVLATSSSNVDEILPLLRSFYKHIREQRGSAADNERERERAGE